MRKRHEKKKNNTAEDGDALEITEEEFPKMRPLGEAFPDLLKGHKTRVTIRSDEEFVTGSRRKLRNRGDFSKYDQ